MQQTIYLDKRALVNGRSSNIFLDNYINLDKYINNYLITNGVTPGGNNSNNFANTDLILDANRTHIGANFDIIFDSFNNWQTKLSGDYNIDNSTSNIKITNGVSNITSLDSGEFSWGDETNYALNYLTPTGGGTSAVLGLKRLLDNGGADEREDHIWINGDNHIALDHTYAGGVSDAIISRLLLTDTSSYISFSNSTTGDSTELNINENNILIKGNGADSYTMSKESPTGNYEALIAPDNTDDNLEFHSTIPQFVTDGTEQPAAGPVDANVRYKKTVDALGSVPNFTTVITLNAEETVVGMEGIVDIGGVKYSLPYVDIAGGNAVQLVYEPGNGVYILLEGLIDIIVDYVTVYYYK